VPLLPRRARAAVDLVRDKSVARALGPDVVNVKGQRVPFTHRGWEPQDRDQDDDKTTSAPRASRLACLEQAGCPRKTWGIGERVKRSCDLGPGELVVYA
jgi:hypothetical protein